MTGKAEKFFEKYNLIFLAALAGVYIYSRNKYLGETSYYMHIDELRSAFDSMSLANGGGLHFSGASLYVLFGALAMKLKGGLFSLKLFRLIAVAFGLIGMIFSYLSVYEMKKDKRSAFLEAVVVTTLPVFFTFERTGIPAHMFLYMVPAVFYFLIKGLSTEKNRKMLYFGICAAVFALMLILSGFGGIRTGFSNVPGNAMNFVRIFWDDGHPYNISGAFGTIYVFSIPVLIAGVIVSIAALVGSIKKKTVDANVILWIYTVVCLVITLFIKDADVRTAGPLFFAISLFITEGLIYICEHIRFALVIETAVYLVCFFVFTGYYYENFNSEVNNSADHEAGLVVDKSVGEAVKASLKELPDKEIVVITNDFYGRNLMIALYGGATGEELDEISDKEEFSFGRITVTNTPDPEAASYKAYIISQYEHQDAIDALTNSGWGCIYLKEYTICFMN